MSYRVIQPSFVQYDVSLDSIPSNNAAVFLISDQEATVTSVVPLRHCDVGKTGYLVTYLNLTPAGDCHRFFPYRIQSLRRASELDRPEEWAWRCRISGDIEWRTAGTPPEHWVPIF